MRSRQRCGGAPAVRGVTELVAFVESSEGEAAKVAALEAAAKALHLHGACDDACSVQAADEQQRQGRPEGADQAA